MAAVGLVAAACTSDSGPDEFAEFPSIRAPIEVLYSEQLMQDDTGRVVSCVPVLEEFTCTEVFEIVGIDLADFSQTQQARSALWLSCVHLRGELDAPVLTVSSVNAEPDVETINDLPQGPVSLNATPIIRLNRSCSGTRPTRVCS